MSQRPTIADVAHAAGVSASTASVVFSGKVTVSEATKIKVLDAAAALGYGGPDPRAAGLRRGRSGIVGVVVGGSLRRVFLDPVVIATMDGIAEGIASLEASMLLLRGDGAGPSLTQAPVDAIILLGESIDEDTRATLNARGLPIVGIEADAGPDAPTITLDNVDAQRQLARHVRSLGHTDVALVTLPRSLSAARGWIESDQVSLPVTAERIEGARDIYPDAPIFASEISSIDEGVEAGRVLFASPHPPTAVLAQSDLLAAGVLRAALNAGLRVPEDVSITGFDGVVVDGVAPFRLTTVVQPAFEKGRAAGSDIARLLASETVASVQFTCTFREGNTTAPR